MAAQSAQENWQT